MKENKKPQISVGNPIDLLSQKILQESKNVTQIPIEFEKKNLVPKKSERISFDNELSNETIEDLKSNREQREKFTKRIIIIMCAELVFIALLIFGVFITPFINALAPEISLNLPPLFFTLTIIIGYFYLYKFVEDASKTVKNLVRLILTIGLLTYLNHFPRELHTITFSTIELTPKIINMILYTALAVFAKTTFLASYIIKGLYEALNKKHKQ